jgi:hypothetical protein
VIFWEHLRWIGFYFSPQLQLHIGILRNFARVTDTRAREDIVDKVLRLVVVRAAICIIGKGLYIRRRRGLIHEREVLFHQLHDGYSGRDVGAFEAIIKQVEVPQKMLVHYVVFTMDQTLHALTEHH